MTTTPAPTDLDELRDLNEAATPAPWQIDFAIGDGTYEISAAPDVLLCYCVGTDHDVTLIVKMRNELATLRADVEWHHETLPKVTDQRNDYSRQLDAAREELAKTRAELETARAVALSNKRAHQTAFEECERLTAELAGRTLWHYYATCNYCGAATGNPCLHMDETRAVRNIPHLSRDVLANPATTAEPAAPHCGLCGSETCPGKPGEGCMPGPFETYAVPETECIQVVIVPELRPRLEQWLAFNGLVLARIPADVLSDDLPTYVVHPMPPSSSVGGTTTSSEEQTNG